MGHSDVALRWNPESIAKILRDNAIRNRCELASRLVRRGVSQTTVYRQFDQGWCGAASVVMVTALAKEFHVALAQLVIEPFEPAEEPA